MPPKYPPAVAVANQSGSPICAPVASSYILKANCKLALSSTKFPIVILTPPTTVPAPALGNLSDIATKSSGADCKVVDRAPVIQLFGAPENENCESVDTGVFHWTFKVSQKDGGLITST